MVGKRGLVSSEKPGDSNGRPKSSAGGRPLSSSGDLEQGPNGYQGANGNARPRPNAWRFRDAVHTAVEDARREELKKALLDGVDRDALEKFRKSDEQLKEIKNKKVRAFYEAQNQRLNDWLEVDATVMAIADDVLESMDPDPDNDGHRERGGGIQEVSGKVGELLPEEEREKRAKAQKKAKWAINVSRIVLTRLLYTMGDRSIDPRAPTADLSPIRSTSSPTFSCLWGKSSPPSPLAPSP